MAFCLQGDTALKDSMDAQQEREQSSTAGECWGGRARVRSNGFTTPCWTPDLD